MAKIRRRGFLKALLMTPVLAKAAITKAEKVPLAEIPDGPPTKSVTESGVIRLPSVMCASSCCIMTGDW